MDSLLKTLVISTLVASCLSAKCVWVPDQYCGNKTCDDHRVMWTGWDHNSNQKTKFLCPMSDGHDVVMCEHASFVGECYTQTIPRGRSCVNVEAVINNLASSVHILGGCIRLYDEPNCKGEWQLCDEGRCDYGHLTDMDDRVSSVGLCTEEDNPRGGCHGASPEGRLECSKNKCYWLAKPNCGNQGTCGDDHFIRTGFDESNCGKQSTKLCCPKSDGHDVILCEHFDLEGECWVTHIPKGEKCGGVAQNDAVSSVHALEGCITLYEDANCNKKMKVVDKNTVGYNLPLDMNDKLTSVGLCSAENLRNEGCNRASPQGRQNCLSATSRQPEPLYTEGRQSPAPQLNTTPKTCILSLTYVNGKRVCKGSVILDDDFQRLDANTWDHEIKIATKPDYEFTVYDAKRENTYVRDSLLHLKPTVYKEDFVENGEIHLERCTGDEFDDECSLKANYRILPPIQSARITTRQKINFKYGVVEVEAKFPKGDWIVADIRLVPTDLKYGTQYDSGLIRFMSRGNHDLKNAAGEEIGSQIVEGAVMVGRRTNVKTKSVYFRQEYGWRDEFHKFKIIWTPDDISFLVDGRGRKNIMRNAQGSRLSNVVGLDDNAHLRSGTYMAPFDETFYLSLSVSVGGVRDFEDGSDNNGKSKPWSNTDPQARLKFWNRRNEWKQTWGGDSAFQIKSVKITAL